MNLEPYLTLYTKLNSKYTMMDLSIKAKKLLEENTGENLQYLGLGKVLLKPQNILKNKKINCTSLKVKTLDVPSLLLYFIFLATLRGK